MIRMVLKVHSPAHIPGTFAMSQFHFLLPDLLRFQDSIPAAVGLLSAACILEGEVVVWNNEVGSIAPFYKIRRHVQRAGRHIGTARDFPISGA